MRKVLLWLFCFVFFGTIWGQKSVEGEWIFQKIENAEGESLFPINSEKDRIKFTNTGSFSLFP